MFVAGTDQKQRPLNDLLLRSLEGYDVINYEIETWWDKPYILLDACKKFGKVVWIDNDVEIVDKRFFTILSIESPAAALDTYMVKRGKKNQYNTGVLVMDVGHVQAWLGNLDKTKHGDQDSFPAPAFTLSNKYNSLRLDPVPDPYAIHWTGDSKWKYLERMRANA